MNKYIFAQYEELFFPFSFWAFAKKNRQLLDVFPSTFGKMSIKWLLDVFLGGHSRTCGKKSLSMKWLPDTSLPTFKGKNIRWFLDVFSDLKNKIK